MSRSFDRSPIELLYFRRAEFRMIAYVTPATQYRKFLPAFEPLSVREPCAVALGIERVRRADFHRKPQSCRLIGGWNRWMRPDPRGFIPAAGEYDGVVFRRESHGKDWAFMP